MSLEDILNDTEPEAKEPESVEQPEVVADNPEPVEARDDIDKVDNAKAEPETKEEVKTVPLPALQDERKKRQELERQKQDLERQLSYLQGQKDATKPEAEQPEVNKEDMVDKLLEDPTEVIDKIVEQKIRQKEDLVWQKNAEAEAKQMETKHTDYKEKAAQFFQMAEQDNSLYAAIRQSDKPAQYIYDYMQLLDMRSDPEALKAKLRKEIEAEMATEKSQEKEPVSKTPKTQAGARSAPPGGDQGFERLSLKDILGNDHFE